MTQQHNIISRCIRDQCSTKHSKSMTSLDISERNLKTLSPADFKDCPNIKDLDASCNELTDIPDDIGLAKLEELDCSNNNLEDILFLAQFPSLKTVYMSGNPNIKMADKYIAAVLCPKLEEVDLGVCDQNLQRSVERLVEKLKLNVEGIWSALYADKYASGICDVSRDTLHAEFLCHVYQQKDVFVVPAMKKFDRFMVERLISELLDRVSKGNYNRSKREIVHKYLSSSPKTTPNKSHTPNKTHTPSGKSLSHSKTTPSTKNLSPSKSTPSKNMSSKKNEVDSKKSARRSLVIDKENLESCPGVDRKPAKRKRSLTTMKLPPVPEYTCDFRLQCHSYNNDPTDNTTKPPVPEYTCDFRLQCHSYNNDPTDNTTKVWCCGFEPDTTQPGQTTSTVATCGGNEVCFIDCTTGKVMKRYKDLNPKESFFALAWGTVECQETSARSNILAVAGSEKTMKLIHPSQLVMFDVLSGHSSEKTIKLIHPSQLVMFDVLSGHNQFINCLQFHPTTPTHLFSGGEEGKVILWDIGTVDLSTYTTNHNHCLLITTPSVSQMEREWNNGASPVSTYTTNHMHKILMVLQAPRAGINNVLYTPEQRYVITGTNKGLYAWNMNGKHNKNSGKDKSRAPCIQFVLPDTDAQHPVDGLALIAKDLIAVKCDMANQLVLFHLNQNLQPTSGSQTRYVHIYDFSHIIYTEVDTSYININSSHSLLCVGDDQRNMHLYNLKSVAKKAEFPADQLSQSKIIENPKVEARTEDEEDNYVVNTIAQSWNNEYIVCGTDNNLVCIWKLSQNS